MTAIQPSLFHQLPTDSVGQIFSFLPLSDLYSTALANKGTWTSTKTLISKTVSHLRVPATITQEKLDAVLQSLPNLSSIHFTPGTCLKDFALLKHCPKLKSLYMRQVFFFASQGIDIQANCPQINSISLISQPNLTRVFFNQLPSRLEKLQLLGMNNLSDKDIAALGTCSHLRSLRLGFLPGITQTALNHLEKIPKLTSLKLHDLQCILGKDLAVLANCKRLSNLELKNMPKVVGHHLSFLSNLKKFDKLILDHMHNIVGNDLDILANCSNLSCLELQSMVEIFGLQLCFLEKIPKLRALTLSFVSRTIGDDEFSVIGKCSNLQSLKLRGFTKISGQGLACLNQCRQLTSLTLSRIMISSTDFACLPMPQLRDLTLEELLCDVTEIKHYLRQFPQLTVIFQELKPDL